MAAPVWRTALAAGAMAATVAVGVAAVSLMPRHAVPPFPAPKPAAARPLVARPHPAPAPASTPPAVAAAAAPRIAPPPIRTRRLAQAQADRPHPALRRPAAKMAQVVAPRPPPSRAAVVRTGACFAPASVADRLVCAHPALAAQDRELKRAYDRALSAGADRLAIDRGQAKWRERRERARSPDELTRLYAQRIDELAAAAADARQPRPARRG